MALSVAINHLPSARDMELSVNTGDPVVTVSAARTPLGRNGKAPTGGGMTAAVAAERPA